jgi:HlyD family secretion protein
LLALLRSEADLQGQEGELLSRIARADEQIGETELQIINIMVRRREETDQQLSETQARRVEVEQQIRDSLDRLSRMAVTAPVSGHVIDLRFRTTGGVIRPGEQILDIIPDDGDLTVDLRIAPSDIDDVHAGLHAYVLFPAFPQRNMRRVEAQVEQVSADVFQDDRTGERYYTGKVLIDRDHLRSIDPTLQLTPGMPAEVFVATTDRTLLQYLVQPLLFTIERSFREH